MKNTSENLFIDLSRYPVIAYDTETTGLNAQAGDRVFGFSVSTPDGTDLYFDVRQTPRAVDWFNDQMKQYKGVVACHNLSFDYVMSHFSGLQLPLPQCVDTCVIACLINEHEISFGLDYLSKKYLPKSNHKQGDQLYSEMAKIFGGRATRNVQMKRIADAPAELVAEYAKSDTRATLELYFWQQDQIKISKPSMRC